MRACHRGARDQRDVGGDGPLDPPPEHPRIRTALTVGALSSVCMYVYVCICIYVYIYIYMYMHISLSLYIYIYIFIYTHLYIHAAAPRRPETRPWPRSRTRPPCSCRDDYYYYFYYYYYYYYYYCYYYYYYYHHHYYYYYYFFGMALQLVEGNFASQDFDMFLRNSCGSFAENCGDLRRGQIHARTVQKNVKILARKIP